MAFIGGWFNQGTGGGLNVFSGSLSAFSVQIRKLSCKRLRMVRELLTRRIKTLGSAWLGTIRNAKKIKRLKVRLVIVKRVYRQKCIDQGTSTSTSTNTSNWWRSFVKPGMGRAQMRKLMRCVKIANSRFRMPTSGGWMIMAQRMAVIAKRRAYVKKCMRATNPGGGGFLGGVFGNFDGQYSNAAAPMQAPQSMMAPPPSNATIPGQPYTSIPRPSRPVKPTVMPGPFIGGWPQPAPQPQVPYHRHSIFDFEIKTGGPTRNKYYTPQIDVPKPIPTPVSPGPTEITEVPATRNFGGDTTSWQNNLDY